MGKTADAFDAAMREEERAHDLWARIHAECSRVYALERKLEHALDRKLEHALERKLEHALDRIETLESEVTELKGLLGGKPVLLPGWVPHLARREGSLLELLIRRQRVSAAAFETILGRGVEDPDNLLKQYVHRLRLKLGPVGVQIHSEHGFGYYLDDDSRAKLRRAKA